MSAALDFGFQNGQRPGKIVGTGNNGHVYHSSRSFYFFLGGGGRSALPKMGMRNEWTDRTVPASRIGVVTGVSRLCDDRFPLFDCFAF
jgi:hypothetical protein